jgi:diadenylate cyclase
MEGNSIMDWALQFFLNHWRSGFEILILTILLYQIFAGFKATKAARIGLGILILIATLYLLTNLLKLPVIGLVLNGVLYMVGTGLVVLFQPELRRLLEKVASRFIAFSEKKSDFLLLFQDTVTTLANKRFGALFAFERGIDLDAVAETGVAVDALFSKELVLTIFHPKTALHDGGVIIKSERVLAAGCVFPLTQRQMIDRSIGLRHRAGLGIAEETDAICVIISEETGGVSICKGGKIEQNIRVTDLARKLETLLGGESAPPSNPNHESKTSLPA